MRVILPALALALLVFLRCLDAPAVRFGAEAVDVPDTLAYHTAAKLCHEGKCNHIYDANAMRASQHRTLEPFGVVFSDGYASMGFLYPPVATIAFWPLGLVDFPTAYQMIGLCNLAALIGILLIIRKTTQHWPAIHYWGFISFVLFSGVIDLSLRLGQVAPIMLWCLLWHLTAPLSSRLQSIALAFAMIFKPHMLLYRFIWLLAQKSWQNIIPMVCFWAVLCGATLGIYGAGIFQAYLPELRAISLNQNEVGSNADCQINLLSLFMFLFGKQQAYLHIIAWGAYMAGIILTAILAHRFKHQASSEIIVACVLLMNLFLSPWLHSYDLALAVPALMVLYHRMHHSTSECALFWLVNIPFFLLFWFQRENALVGMIYPLFLLFLCVRQLRDAKETSPLFEAR